MLLDGVVILLLLATIGYAAVLNRRLQRLRAAKDEMAAVLKDFVGASAQAEEALGRLNGAGQATAKELDRLLERARQLGDDLVFLIDRGGKLADGLSQGGLSQGGQAKSGQSKDGRAKRSGSQGAPTKPRAAAQGIAGKAPVAGAEAELLKSLQGMR